MTSRAAWIGLFGAYFLAQAFIRVLIGPALELDEAEAFWFARDLSLGYNAQPPLYFWLQWGLFQVLGEEIIALAALKALLLWVALTALYLMLSRHVAPMQAGVAVLALGFLPQVVWEAQRALTHSVLVLAMAVLCFVAFRRLVDRGRWEDHVLFGIVVGLGVISKYNFVLVPSGLLLWSVLSDEARHIDWRRFAVSVAIAAAIVSPVAFWSLANTEVAGGSVHKLGIAATGIVTARVQGLLSLGVALAGFFALAIVVLGGLWGFRERRAALRPEVMKVLAGGAAGGLILLVTGLLLAGVTEVKDRWLLPVAWPLVPAAVLWLWPVLGGRQRRGLALGAGGVWIVAMLGLPYASLRDPGYRAGDFAGLEAAMASIDARPQTVVSNSVWVLGNLALRNSEMPLVHVWDGGGPGILITGQGQSREIAASLGLLPGVPVEHEIRHGVGTTTVDIVTVARP